MDGDKIKTTLEAVGGQAKIIAEFGLTPWLVVLLAVLLLMVLGGFSVFLNKVVNNAQRSSEKERGLFRESLERLQETFTESITAITHEMKYTSGKLGHISDRISRVEAKLHLEPLGKRESDHQTDS